ncbi:MAG: nickel-dependent lactate racemase [Eubacteriales bacterium]
MSVTINLKYGNQEVQAIISTCRYLGEIRPNPLPEITQPEQEIINGLRQPIGAPPVDFLARGKGRAAIVISDHTRPLTSRLVLPLLIKELELGGLSKESIIVVIGVGNHRPVTENEKEYLLGPLYGQIKCQHSKETGYRMLGITKRGTPVEVAEPVAEADLVIAVGCIEPHQLAGFSGGVKAVAAGAASRRALEHNHKLGTLQGNALGQVEGNIVRRDMEEFAQIAGLHFIINIVLNEEQRVVQVAAGDPIKAHRAGEVTAGAMCCVKLHEAADIVVVSPGGTPKDDTVYQAQKSVRNALRAVVQGGIIIVAAKCPEGFGDPVFEEWMNAASSPKDIERRSAREFVLGGHKGAFIAQAVNQARIFWVSDMEQAQVRKLFFESFSSLQEAVDAAVAIKGDDARVLVMPYGGLTVPGGSIK